MPQLLTIHFALDDEQFGIERTLRVPDHYSCYELHLCLQVALGWNDLESFEFFGHGLTVGVEAHFMGDGVTFEGHRYRHADEVTLADLFGPIGEVVSYVYDFARFWTGRLTLRARQWELDELPSCISAVGENVPELLDDCDSNDLLRQAYLDPRHHLYPLAAGTFGEDWQFGAPDPDEITAALEELFGELVEPHGGDDAEAEDEDWGWWDPSKYNEDMRLRVLKAEFEEQLAAEVKGDTPAARQAALLAALKGGGGPI